MIDKGTLHGSAAHSAYDSSSCRGALAGSSAAPNSLASLIKNAVWVPGDIGAAEAPPVMDRPPQDEGGENA